MTCNLFVGSHIICMSKVPLTRLSIEENEFWSVPTTKSLLGLPPTGTLMAR